MNENGRPVHPPLIKLTQSDAFLARWQDGDDIESCFRFALAAATAASTETDPGLVDEAQTDALVPAVSITSH